MYAFARSPLLELDSDAKEARKCLRMQGHYLPCTRSELLLSVTGVLDIRRHELEVTVLQNLVNRLTHIDAISRRLMFLRRFRTADFDFDSATRLLQIDVPRSVRVRAAVIPREDDHTMASAIEQKDKEA